MWGLSPVSFHDYPEYQTPSKQYRNGPNQFFGELPAFQGCTMTLAHPDQTHMQKYGKSGKHRFHSLEHESKTRPPKTHSHTSERLVYEARRYAKKRDRRKGRNYTKANRRKKPHAYSTASVPGQTIVKTSCVPPAWREGETRQSN